MSRKIPSKDEALEALDFIVNVLKEHEKDLDRLINELGTITEKMGDTGVLSGKVEKVEERLSTLQNEIGNLINQLSTSREQTPSVAQTAPSPKLPSFTPSQIPMESKTEGVAFKEIRGPPVILRCKVWEDFLGIATQAQTLSFMYREQEKIFQVDAVKDNQIITYSGSLPKETAMLKAWLSRQLEVPEKKILEGLLTIG